MAKQDLPILPNWHHCFHLLLLAGFLATAAQPHPAVRGTSRYIPDQPRACLPFPTDGDWQPPRLSVFPVCKTLDFSAAGLPVSGVCRSRLVARELLLGVGRGLQQFPGFFRGFAGRWSVLIRVVCAADVTTVLGSGASLKRVLRRWG